MNNLLSLIKVDLCETLDMRKLKENKARTTSFLSFILLMGALFLGLSAFYNYQIVGSFNREGVPLYKALLFVGGVSSLLIFMTGIFRIKGIFTSKDYDLLASMPIKKSHIIISKIVSMYIVEFFYGLILTLPTIIFCFYYDHSAIYLYGGLILLIFIPLFPLIIAALFSLLLSLVADRFRFANIINIVCYIIFFVGIMYFSMKISMGSTDDSTISGIGAMLDGYADRFKWINPTLALFALGFTSNVSYILLFIAVSLVSGALAVGIIALLFDKVHDIISSFKSSRKYVKKELVNKGQGKALFANEWKHLISSKLYFMNSFASVIATVAVVIVLIITFNQTGLFKEDIIKDYAFVGGAICVFMLGISTTASSGISIEGPNFWLIKSLPIDYKIYARVKIAVSTLLLMVGAVISSTAIVIAIKPSIIQIIFIYLLPIIYCFFVSCLSLVINLHSYKLKWKNEADCVKRSAAVFIVMIVDFFISLAIIGGTIGLAMLNTIVSMSVVLAVIILAAIITYICLMNQVERCIDKIENF